MSDHMQQAREMLRNADAAIVVRELLKARDGVAEKWREAIAERDALAARVGANESVRQAATSLAAIVLDQTSGYLSGPGFDAAQAARKLQAALDEPSAPVEAAPEAPSDEDRRMALAAALGWPGGISAEPSDWPSLLQHVARLRVAAHEAPAEPVAPDRDEAIRIWRKHCAPFSNKLGAHPPSVVVAAMMDFASAAIAAARAEGEEQMRDVLQRCVKGIDHLAELARLWEPDHSSGADRRGWVLANDARDDAAELLRALPVEAPNVAGEAPEGSPRPAC